MDLVQAVLLGLVQGVTEWLPVSSSGHLAFAQMALGLQVPVAFDILLHFGTLAAVVVFYREKISRILAAVFRLDFKSEDGWFAWLLLLGSIPTAVVGFGFKAFFASMFVSPFLLGGAFILTGCLLYATKFVREGRKSLGWLDAFIVGVAQGIAVAPGISRSGWTISAAIINGVEREKAADFAFLLSIPAIVGAAALEGGSIVFSGIDLFAVGAGVLVAAVVGYASIAFLLNVLRKGELYWFAFYCWLVGLAAIAFGLKLF